MLDYLESELLNKLENELELLDLKGEGVYEIEYNYCGEYVNYDYNIDY